jgi:hypothetical protein
MDFAAATAGSEIVSKSQFAGMCNVTPGRVSQWISERKIYGDALDGHGRGARIRVSVARAQLNRRLDIGQRLGNGLSTTLAGPDAPHPAVQPDPAPSASSTSPAAVDPVEERIKRERLEQLQRANREAAKKEAAGSGLLTGAEAAAQQMGRIAAQIVTLFEGALPEFSSAIAAKFQVPQRDVLHLLRGEFRKVRANAAVTYCRMADGMPALSVFDLGGGHVDPDGNSGGAI